MEYYRKNWARYNPEELVMATNVGIGIAFLGKLGGITEVTIAGEVIAVGSFGYWVTLHLVAMNEFQNIVVYDYYRRLHERCSE